MLNFSNHEVKEMFKKINRNSLAVHMSIIKKLRRYHKAMMDIPDTKYGVISNISKVIVVYELQKGQSFKEVKDDKDIEIVGFKYKVLIYDYMTKKLLNSFYKKSLSDVIDFYLNEMMEAYKNLKEISDDKSGGN